MACSCKHKVIDVTITLDLLKVLPEEITVDVSSIPYQPKHITFPP